MKSLTHMVSTSILCTFLSNCTPPPAPEPSTPTVNPPAKSPQPAKKPHEGKSAAIEEIDITRLFTLKTENKALVYDVRLPLYYKLGHIDGAILFYPKPFDEAFDREEPQMKMALSEGKVIVLYCGAADCHDSHIVAKMIAERGIPVSVYSGGWAEWKELGIE
jgi:rhodanese-related sulfurtransferase